MTHADAAAAVAGFKNPWQGLPVAVELEPLRDVRKVRVLKNHNLCSRFHYLSVRYASDAAMGVDKSQKPLH